MDIFTLKVISTILGGFSALLLFFFGIPAMTKSETYTTLSVKTEKTTTNDKKNKIKYAIFNIISKIALLMLVGSFTLQFVILYIEK